MHRAMRRLAWVCLGLLLALAALWAISLRWGLHYERWRLGFNVYDGGVTFWYVKAPDGRGQGFRVNDVTIRSHSWIPQLPGAYSNPRESFFWLPFWIPLSLLTPATTVLFWKSRKCRPGECSACGYNLSGNISGRCPECGAQADRDPV